MTKIPVTVFTGFLGAGKTSIILSLLKSLPKDYTPVLLKNEFGDANVDSRLAKEQNIQISEIINGCLCCVLVGQMKTALYELKKLNPDRIIIETSGSAFPAPIAWQIRELQDDFILDAIITVIDVSTFNGYADTSYTGIIHHIKYQARLQAQYSDLIILNKYELITEREFDLVLDKVNELNLDTTKVRFSLVEGGVSADLVFGLDSKLFEISNKERDSSEFTLETDHHQNEVDVIRIKYDSGPDWTQSDLDKFLSSLSVESFYRVKGVIELETEFYILNWAFGRYSLTLLTTRVGDISKVHMNIMGLDLRSFIQILENSFGKGNVILT